MSWWSRSISGCGLVGIIHRKKKLIEGEKVICAICNMEERGNGLGAGFAAYGIYPDYRDFYAFHIMYDNETAIGRAEEILMNTMQVEHSEQIPTRRVLSLGATPIFRRYFVKPLAQGRPHDMVDLNDDDYVVKVVMAINAEVDGAYVVSSGKDMGVFKGVGQPDEIADFFRIDEYKAHIWSAHTRFPTNTPGWWGGAHPFALLDWSIVHNGEISSYGINKRYLEMFGYKCTLLTDTEVVAYLCDLLIRRHGLSLDVAASVLAPPFWKDIDRMEEEKREFYTRLRMIYGSAALNGPFAIVLAYERGIMGLNDRIKLRPLVAGYKGDIHVLASENAAIHEVIPDPDEVWMPKAGEPTIVELEDGGN